MISYHLFMNRNYVSFLPFFRETFTLEAVLKENCQWFWNWRSAYFYHTDRYFIASMSLIRIQWPYDVYNIAWTNFRSKQSFLGFKSWDRTVVVYYYTLLTKVIIKQICFYKKKKTDRGWLPTKNGGISGILVPSTNIFSIFQ